MSQPHLDNPAGRLLDILTRMRAQSPQNVSVIDATLTAFGIDKDTTDYRREYHLRVADMYALPADVRARVALYQEADPDELLSHMSEVDAVLSNMQNPARPVAEVLSPLTEIGLKMLRMCDRLLHNREPMPTLDTADRDELIQQVRDLVDAIRESDDLDAASKTYLVQRLLDVHDALIDFDLTGAIRLLDVTDRAAGSVERVLAEKGDDRSGVLARIKMLMPKVVSTLKLAAASYTVIHDPGAAPPMIQVLYPQLADLAPRALQAKEESP
jgi:hypothetical protein